jgi:hypothetical protein
VADPYAREIGRIEDIGGQPVIVGVDYDTVTIEGGQPLRLTPYMLDEFAQLFTRACWEAGAQQGAAPASAWDGFRLE